MSTPQHKARPTPGATPTSKQEEIINAVRKYNEDVLKPRGPDVAPPVPLKKKTG